MYKQHVYARAVGGCSMLAHTQAYVHTCKCSTVEQLLDEQQHQTDAGGHKIGDISSDPLVWVINQGSSRTPSS